MSFGSFLIMVVLLPMTINWFVNNLKVESLRFQYTKSIGLWFPCEMGSHFQQAWRKWNPNNLGPKNHHDCSPCYLPICTKSMDAFLHILLVIYLLIIISLGSNFSILQISIFSSKLIFFLLHEKKLSMSKYIFWQENF